MKKIPVILITVAVLGVVGFVLINSPSETAQPPKPAEVPDRNKAADFTLPTHDGRTLTLSSLEGERGVVLVFFATWCPPCMAEVPHVKRFVEETRDKGLLVFGVNIAQPKEVVDKFVESAELNYRVLLDSDGKVATAYGVTGIPHIVGIDAAGIVRYSGHQLPDNTQDFAELLSAPLGAKRAAAGQET